MMGRWLNIFKKQMIHLELHFQFFKLQSSMHKIQTENNKQILYLITNTFLTIVFFCSQYLRTI